MTGEPRIEALLSAEDIGRKVVELADALSRDYDSKPLLLVGVLKGAVVFLADLVRRLTIPVEYDFVGFSSYGSSTVHRGAVTVTRPLAADVRGKHVVIVEDIVDSGLTLRYLRDYLLAQRPASLCIVALLDKEIERADGVQINYTGFRIPDRFVVGYGLDYAERYRNLPYVGVIKSSVAGGADGSVR